jgi:uncharacterized protein (TIGR02246 family)
MTNAPSPASSVHAQDTAAVESLHRALLDAWNARDAGAFAAVFDAEGHVVGFDGSEMHGPDEVASTLARIFADHPTAAYVAKVRDVRPRAPDAAILRAVAGMVLPGQTDLNPAVNTIQTLVAAKAAGEWRISHCQNTPAQFHGRLELSHALTEELRQLLPVTRPAD